MVATPVGILNAMADKESIYRPLQRASRAAVAFIGHQILGMIVIGANWLVEKFIQFLYQDSEPMLYSRFPLRWLFDTADLGVLLVFIFWGIYEANQKLKG
jgi:hypothetical protein